MLEAGAKLQAILPSAILVGGSSAAIHARHRRSLDADQDRVLAHLESVAGWKTARIKRSVLILGSLDGIETGIRQLVRTAPLETTALNINNRPIQLPTSAEILRIKSVLILKRNATRDYLDFAALAYLLGLGETVSALKSLDKLYPQQSGESTLQLQIQLAEPMPYDLEETNLKEYKNLVEPWTSWPTVKEMCAKAAIAITKHLAATARNRLKKPKTSPPPR